MDLENVKKGLINEANAEARAILNAAENDSSSAISMAKDKEKSIIAAAKKRANDAAEAERNERISAAKLKARKMTADAMNRVVDGASMEVWHEFVKVRGSASYEKMLKGLITQGEKELGEKSIVHVNESDIKLAKKFFPNVSAKPIDISGGAVVVSKAGNISIDNSFESIFGSRKDDIKKIIFRELKGERK